eukprot:m.97708 g.97708  ORF g.97708 m.97708 type:complete len:53 (+) comp12405_c0_seq3:214-372(+)
MLRIIAIEFRWFRRVASAARGGRDAMRVFIAEARSEEGNIAQVPPGHVMHLR